MRILRFLQKHVTAVLTGLCLLVGAAGVVYGVNHREARRDAELYADSLEAALDTTRQVLVTSIAGISERARIFQRRSVQLEGELQDQIAENLELQSRARADVDITIPTRSVEGLPSPQPVATEGEVRVASVQYREEPFTADVTARVPPHPDTASWDISLTLDALHLQLSVACGDAPEGREVRPATVHVAGPPWADVRLDSVQTSAGVCNPRVGEGWSLFGWDPPVWLEVGIPALVGLEIGRRLP